MKHRQWIVLGLGLLILTGCRLFTPTPAEPTSTPTITNTPAPSATPTATLTPTPTATPIPAVRIVKGDQALFNGDYFHSRDEYQIALNSSSDPKVQAAALWGLGQTDYRAGLYPQALESLRRLTAEFPASDRAPYGYFLLGQTYDQLARYDDAAAAYAQYLQLRPGMIDSYATEVRADALFNAGRYAEAISAYQSALAAPHLGEGIDLKIGIALAYAYSGDNATALKLYDEIAGLTGDEYIKAQMELLAGRAHLAMGENDLAYARFRHTVENYPLSYDSYSALVALVEADQPVDDFQRGLVDYYAGQNGLALAAFNRFISEHPDHDGTVLYYRALTHRQLGNYQEAVDDWSAFIAQYNLNRYWGIAWDDKAYTQWAYLEEYSAAAQTFEDFATIAPGSPYVVDYLMKAARILERDNKLSEAAQLWGQIAEGYPSDPIVPQALFNAGIVRYRLGDYASALTNFQRSLLLASDVSDQARAYLWIGKSQQMLGKQTEAHSAWQTAQALAPYDYYGARSRDLLLGNAPFTPGTPLKTEIDPIKERAEAEAWMRIKFNLPAGADLAGLGSLLNDPRLWRGTEFWELGLFDEARIEFEDLRAAIKDNPIDTFRLGNYLIDLGMYRSGIEAIRQVLTLAGLNEQAASQTAPAYFKHIRYGQYYAEIIQPIAQEYNFDPLFVTSLVRQESLFEGFVRSTAGARGLMQIIVPTGESIADQLGWPLDYTSEDLFSPYVSVRFGIYYLNSNRKLFDGDLYAALAAYNGGPGNTALWKELAGNDPDLLLEVIRFAETRDYIRNIYETYTLYRSLYTTAP
jgi:soluble lytic murein transglycosylase